MRLMRFMCIPALALVLAAQGLHAATLGDEKAVRETVDQVMTQIAKDNVKGGIELLVPYWGSISRSLVDGGVSKAAEQRKLFQSRFGKSIGVQFIEQTIVAETFLRLVYIEKLENAAIRWVFFFYNPGGGWRFNFFTVDDNIGALFQPTR